MPVGEALHMLADQYAELLWGAGFPVLLLVVVLTALVISRGRALERQMLGTNRRSLVGQVFGSLLLGLGGGFLGSLVFVFFGISVDLDGATIGALWAVVFVLLLFDFRFVCFSYAGSVVALGHLLFGWPQVNVAGLMALVAVLHGVEALLITVSGGREAVPVYLRRGSTIVGGFVLQKAWPVAAVILMGQTGARPGAVPTPSWWPLISSQLQNVPGQTLTYILIPIMVVLAYSDFTTTMDPMQKGKRAGALLALYSAILLGLAVQAGRWPGFAFAAAVFGAAGHEAVIHLSRRLEGQRKDIYVSSPQGMRLLDILPGSAAEEIGLMRGDVLLSVNDQPLNGRRDLERLLERGPLHLRLGVVRGGQPILLEFSGTATHLGIVPVPGASDTSFVEFRSGGLLRRVFARLQGRGQGA